MDLTTRIQRLLLRIHPDPHVREAARERDRRARERARYPEFMRMVSEELQAQAALKARLQAEEERHRAALSMAAPAREDRPARVEAEREKAPEALPPATWQALKTSAAVRTEDQFHRRCADVLALAGVRPETIASPSLTGAILEAAVQEVERGPVRAGMCTAVGPEIPAAAFHVVITASALDAVAVTQLHPVPGAACIAVGASPTGSTIREVRRVLDETQTRLRAASPAARLTVTLAFGRREGLLAELVNGAAPVGAVVERWPPPVGETWSDLLAKVEQERIRRSRVQSAGRARGPAL
jgi:hypothetical protein